MPEQSALLRGRRPGSMHAKKKLRRRGDVGSGAEIVSTERRGEKAGVSVLARPDAVPEIAVY